MTAHPTPKERTVNPDWPKRIKLYVHGDKESAWDAVEKAGLTGVAARLASFMSTEHAMEYEVAEDGASKLVAVDGRNLEECE